MSETAVAKTVEGEGYAVGSIDGIGEGPGFRKIRHELGVTAFGVNAIVLPENWTTNWHCHEEQEELYLVTRGRIAIEFRDGGSYVLEEGGLARVDAPTVRRVRNVGEGESTYVCVGGKDGYVGRDGKWPEGEEGKG